MRAKDPTYPVMQRTFCAKGVCDLLCALLVGQMRLGGLGMAILLLP